MITGTSHFVSLAHATRYYREYGNTPAEVESMVASGVIHIGKPDLKDGQWLTIVDGTRYAIVDAKP